MRLKVSAEVVERLANEGQKFLLTLNDGSNPFSNAEGCCMIGDRFLIVATEGIPESYSIEIPSNQLKFYTSKYDCIFLKGELYLDMRESSQTLTLRDNSGRLDDHVQIKVL